MIFHAFYKNRIGILREECGSDAICISMLREGVAQWAGGALPFPECRETYKERLEDAQRTLRGRSEDAQRTLRGVQRTFRGRSEALRGHSEDSQRTFRGRAEDAQRRSEAAQRMFRGRSEARSGVNSKRTSNQQQNHDHVEAAQVQHCALEREPEHRVCLLYTSPSPRDQRGSRMPSSA